MNSRLEKPADVQSDEAQRLQQYNTARLMGSALLTISGLASMATLSYVAIDSKKSEVETMYVYPSIDSQLRDWDFNEVSRLLVNVKRNQFSFTTLLTKMPEDSDVVGELIPADCFGTYQYKDSAVVVNEDIVCDDNGTIPNSYSNSVDI